MTTRSLKAALLTSAVLGAVLAPAAAASAHSLTIDDSTADTWENVYNPDTQSDDWLAAGSQPNIDITATVVKHSANKIVITTTFDDLKAKGARYGVVDHLRFDQGPKVVAVVDAMSKWKGQSSLYTNHSGQQITCAGLTHTIDYTADTVEISIPRSCVGKPTWVEVGEFTVSNVTDDTGTSHSYMDDADSAGHNVGSWSDKVRRG